MRKLLRMVLLIWPLSSLGAYASTIDLNTADAAELEQVKGIGPAKARAIVEYRDANGPFGRISDLKKVPGVGNKTLREMRRQLRIGPTGDSDKGLR